MELQDYDGMGDSDVLLDGGFSGIGPINGLQPRFEPDETEESDRQLRTDRTSSKKRDTSNKKRQLSQTNGRNSRLSPSNVQAQTVSTMLKVPMSVVHTKVKQEETVFKLDPGRVVDGTTGRTPNNNGIKIRKLGSVSPKMNHSRQTTANSQNLKAILEKTQHQRNETLTKVGAARSNPRMSGNNQIDATPNRNGSFHNPARRLHHSPIGPGQENLSKIENGNNTMTF